MNKNMQNQHEDAHHQSDINVETIYGTVNNSLNGLRKMIKDNPKVVLGTALAIGLLVGLMVGGNKNNSSEKQGS